MDSLILDIVATVAMFSVFFLPALIELKKPRDAGPRLIGLLPAKAPLAILDFLINLDEEPKLDNRLIIKNSTLSFLPNMEAYVI